MTNQTILPITIQPHTRRQTFTVRLDAARMERLAANLGLFRKEFLNSLERAERETTGGKTKPLSSLRALRKRKQ